ncbi:meiotic recombination protein REC114-like [Amblyomma americanum]
MAGSSQSCSQSFQCSLPIFRKFPLKRYGVFIPEEGDDAANDKGTWKVLVSTSGEPLFIYITDTDMMVVNQGPISHECVFLLNSKDWVRGFMKGNSILILSRFNGNNERRFRVEFDRFADKTAVEQCQQCTDLLSQYFPFQNTKELAPATSTGIDFTGFFNQQFESPELLQDLVKACLRDPSFPKFVEQVEDAMKGLLSQP